MYFFGCLAERVTNEDCIGGWWAGNGVGSNISNLCLVYYFAALFAERRIGKGGFLCIYHLGGHCVGAEAPVDCFFLSRVWFLARDDVPSCGDVLFHSEKKSHGIHTLCIDHSAGVIWSFFQANILPLRSAAVCT